ncbi:hypothetical protein JAAARDRAFT_715845, partial [Jaapia argillacea MUCL 33604]
MTPVRVEKYVSDFSYPRNAPLHSLVDDSKLIPSLLPFWDGPKEKWFITGSTGDAWEVGDIEKLQDELKNANIIKATKIRLWAVQIPLPAVPPLVLAVVPIAGSTTAVKLFRMEKELLDCLLPRRFNIISLASDGASVEREAR